MLKINIIVVGKTREPYWQQAEAEFIKRIRKYANLEITIVKGEKISASKNEQMIRAIEAQQIELQIQKSDFTIVLDKDGRQLSSEQFAQFLADLPIQGHSRLCFLIGGPLGLPEAFIRHCNFQLSFSPMTFTHEMIRLLLLEQIYRGFSILNNEKYHK